MALDDFDRALMAATQGGLPLVPRPYDAVGQQLGVSGQQVRERLAQMLETGLPVLAFPKEREFFVELKLPLHQATGAAHGA